MGHRHISGQQGNETVDKLAKEALKKNLVDVTLGRNEIKSGINRKIIRMWQQDGKIAAQVGGIIIL